MLAPKTIDNDLGLNYRNEPDEWQRRRSTGTADTVYTHGRRLADQVRLEQMVNYVTPGYATAVFVSAAGVQRIRTTAESHRRIAIIEVMGRHSGYIALGALTASRTSCWFPKHPLNTSTALVERVVEIYDLQKNVVIVCGEGIVDETGQELGAETCVDRPGRQQGPQRGCRGACGDPDHSIWATNISPASAATNRREAAIFTRKVGHTQRGGRPMLLRSLLRGPAGRPAVDMLLEGQNNCVSTSCSGTASRASTSTASPANDFRDRWGLIHARLMHRIVLRPDVDAALADGDRVSDADLHQRHRPRRLRGSARPTFGPGNLTTRYHSVNIDVGKRIRYLG